MCSISIENIERNEDVYSIFVVISQVMHDKKSYGLEGMLKRYKDNIEKYHKEMPLWDFCALLGILEYLDSSFNYDEIVRTEKPIVDYDLWCEIEFFKELSDEELQDMCNSCISRAIPEFSKRGIFINHVDGVI